MSDGDSTSLDASALGILQRQREATAVAAATPFAGTHRVPHITDPAALQERVALYVRDGIDGQCLAPFNDAWMASAMEQVPTELAGIDPGSVGLAIDEMVEEIHVSARMHALA